jgi:NitT/TauT family transport system permease protein
MLPKIVLVAFVSFLLLFFNTFTGARAVDEEQLDALSLMGASAPERFFKVVLPGCTAWIMAGLKNALPYSLIAAVIGEMMVSRAGLGHLVSRAGQQFDMTGIYAGLFVLMILGAFLNEAVSRTERRLLRWRRAEGA